MATKKKEIEELKHGDEVVVSANAQGPWPSEFQGKTGVVVSKALHAKYNVLFIHVAKNALTRTLNARDLTPTGRTITIQATPAKKPRTYDPPNGEQASYLRTKARSHALQ